MSQPSKKWFTREDVFRGLVILFFFAIVVLFFLGYVLNFLSLTPVAFI